MSIQIQMDERLLHVEKGVTILQAARANGIYIPTLCDFPGLPSRGSCRMCIVAIQGRPNTPTACTTPAEDGMVIQTNSPKIQSLRGELFQLLLSEHPSCCLFCPEKDHCDECMVTLRKSGVTTGCGSCPKDDQCELQVMAEKLGLSRADYPVRYRMLPVEKYDPFFDRDYNLCVLCGRCIRICEELHFNNIPAYTERGTDTVVGTAFNRSHLDAGCSFCGACVEVCPTGALSEKTRKWDGKPDSQTPSTCPLCSIGCPISLLVRNNRVIGSLPNHVSDADGLCVKGRFGITELVNHPTRLKQPQKKIGPYRLDIAWDEAIQTAAEKLAACSPEQFEMVISASCSSEDLFIAQKFTREVMHSDRIRTSAESRYAGNLNQVYDLMRESQPLSVLDGASTILCLGLDGKYAQSVVEVKLHQAKTRGASIVTVNAQAYSLSRYADVWLQPVSGKDSDLLQELCRLTHKETPAYLSDTANSQTALDRQNPVERAAQLLLESSALVVVLGPAFLTHPDNHLLLQNVQELLKNTNARVIVLPEQSNLAGTLLLGLPGPVSNRLEPAVLYLIGEAVPAGLPDQTVILYQNLYPPSGEHPVDLALPTTAFTEEEGSWIDYSGCVRESHPAVEPPGEALPSWKILCKIAQKLGAQKIGATGFEYTCVEEIREDIFKSIHVSRDLKRIPLAFAPQLTQAAAVPSPAAQDSVSEHLYMGYPLTHWVEGLRMLYPEEPI